MYMYILQANEKSLISSKLDKKIWNLNNKYEIEIFNICGQDSPKGKNKYIVKHIVYRGYYINTNRIHIDHNFTMRKINTSLNL
jgi:hypothetical protein